MEPRKAPTFLVVRAVGCWLAAASLFLLLAAGTIYLTSDGRNIATVWPANALLVALLLASERPPWTRVLSAGFVANLAANILTRGGLLGPVLYSAANLIEVTVIVLLLKKDLPKEGLLGAPRTLLRFLLVAGLLAPLISAFVGACTAQLLFEQPFRDAFATWLLADALGSLIFVPVFLALFKGEFGSSWRQWSWHRRGEAAALLACTAAVTQIVFFIAEKPLLFLIYPPVMLVTFRIGRLGVKVAVMIVALIGAVATAHGHGPVVMLAADPVEQAQLFQAFLAVMLLTCLPVAAEVSARARLTQELARREQEMSARAATDSLTGILNRAGFEKRVMQVLGSSRPKVCLAVIDVDHFKQINDRWGHPVGDRALIHLASVLRAHIRAADVVGRLGGDEFVVLLAGDDLGQAEAVCDRIRAGLRRTSFSPDDHMAMMISISCGIAASHPDDRYEDLLSRADEALYRAKAAGRNVVRSVA